MRIHCLLHVPFEGPGNVARWAADRGHETSQTHLFDGEPLPACWTTWSADWPEGGDDSAGRRRAVT